MSEEGRSAVHSGCVYVCVCQLQSAEVQGLSAARQPRAAAIPSGLLETGRDQGLISASYRVCAVYSDKQYIVSFTAGLK